MSQSSKAATDGLKSDIGLISAMSLVVGVVLGAGAFMKPPAVLAAAGDSTTALAAWLVGGLFSMAGGLTLCELGTMYPRTGGVYVYLEEIFGEKVAFLYGWMVTFLFAPATMGALTGYFSSVFCTLFDVPASYISVVSAGVLAFVAFINSVSVRAAGRLQTLATGCKLLPIILLAVFGLWKGNGQVLYMQSGVAGAQVAFSVAVLATLFAYDGWAQVASLGGEIKNPSRILPLAIIGGLVFLIIVYITINVALLKIIPADQLVALGHDASAVAAQKLFGLTGGNLVSVGIMIAIIGGLNGYTMALSRVLYSVSTRGCMPGSRLWSKIDEDSKTPVNAVIVLLIASFVYNLAFDADKLSNIASFSNWIFYMLTFIAVFVARRTRADTPRPYKVPLYPVVPMVAIGGALYVFYGMLATEPMNGVFSILLTLLGLPVFYYMKGAGAKPGGYFPKIRTSFVVGAGSLVLLALLTMSVKVFDFREEIRVAVEPATLPFAFQRDGALTGYDIELMDALAARAGIRVRYVPVALDTVFDAVSSNHADAAVASLSVTPERAARVAFSDAYITDGGIALLVREGADNGLAGKVAGVHKGSTGELYAAKIAGLTVQAFQSNHDMATAFNKGQIDAIIFDRPIIEYMMAAKLIRGGKIVGTLAREEYAIAVTAQNKNLRDKLNKALAEMKKSGELDALYEKWFSATRP